MQMEHLTWHPIESNDDLDSETTSQARMYTLSAYPFIRLTQNQRFTLVYEIMHINGTVLFGCKYGVRDVQHALDAAG